MLADETYRDRWNPSAVERVSNLCVLNVAVHVAAQRWGASLPTGCGPHVSGGRAIVPEFRASQATCRPWSTQLQPGLDFAPGGMRSQRAHISAMQARSVWPNFCSKYLHTQELRRRQERCRATPSLCVLLRSRVFLVGRHLCDE